MKTTRIALVLALVAAVALTTTPSRTADAQAQTIKIGILYDHSGPFSAAGSLNCYRGAKMIIDYVNEHGGVLGKLKEGFGNDVEGFITTDPPAAQLIDPKKLKPGLAALTQEMLKRYKVFEPNIPAGQVAPHVSMGFNNMWILLNDVLPRAIQKHGGFSADALAKAARETDIPEGGTMQGYGVKFQPPGHPMAGQNMRAIAAVFQVVDGDFRHVYPPVVASMANPPVLLPASSPYFAR